MNLQSEPSRNRLTCPCGLAQFHIVRENVIKAALPADFSGALIEALAAVANLGSFGELKNCAHSEAAKLVWKYLNCGDISRQHISSFRPIGANRSSSFEHDYFPVVEILTFRREFVKLKRNVS
jgi:hypothetical protein